MNHSTARLLRAARRGAVAVSSLWKPPNSGGSRLGASAKALRGRVKLPPKLAGELHFDKEGQAVSDEIRGLLLSPAPCMVGRIGHTELKTMVRYKMQVDANGLENVWRYITAKQDVFWWDDAIRWEMQFSSGFFPCEDAMLAQFSERYLADLGEVNVLGSWLPQEALLAPHFASAVRVPLSQLEPFWHRDPWSEALAGRRVLVVHPFESTIQAQYERRAQLFTDRRMLPDFELLTLKSVQSLGGHTEGFETWFDALDAMCDRISRIDFDVAIIGAGAYGIPLAAHVKRLGRKAVHLGGAVQLLFGIRGSRWEDLEFYRNLMNEHWVRPAPEEKPTGFHHVDGGKAYW